MLDRRRRDHSLEETVKLIVRLDHIAIAAAVRRGHEHAEADLVASDAARRLNIFGDIRREPGTAHRVELVDVDAVADRRSCPDVSQRLRTPARKSVVEGKSVYVR